MGKQIRFYMVDQDEDDFVAFLRSTGDAVIVPQATDKEEGEEFSLFRELAGRRLGDDSHIWNRTISPKPIVTYFPVHGGCYCLDAMESEVVNVIRCKRVGGILSMGRLHIDDKATLPDGSVAEKSVAFVSWFHELCRWIKSEYPRKVDGAYLSSRAEAMLKNGVGLAGHSF